MDYEKVISELLLVINRQLELIRQMEYIIKQVLQLPLPLQKDET